MKKIIIVIAIVILALGTSVFVFSQKDDVPPAEKIGSPVQSQSSPKSLVNKSFPSLTDFTANTLDGETFTKDNFMGFDVTVVNIWGTYCGPCREEMPQIGAFSKTLPKNVQFITICVDAQQQRSDANSILSSAGFDGITLISGTDDLVDLVNKIRYVPTTLFFDSEGICVGEEIIGSQSDVASVYTERINSILNEMGKESL